MRALTQPLSEYSEIEKLREMVEKGRLPVRVTGCTDTQKSNLIAAVSEKKTSRLIVAQSDIRARELAQELSLYTKNVFYYPSKDIIFYSADVRGNAITKERLKCIKQLVSGGEVTVVTCFQAGMDKILPLEAVKKHVIRIGSGDSIDIDALTASLVSIGYSREAEVSAPGEFAVRGGIIDIFPLSEEAPYRIELWGDEIDSIRVFDADSQRSVENVDGFEIYPACEIVLDDEMKEDGLAAIEADTQAFVKRLRADFRTEQAARIRRTVDEFKEDLEYLRGQVGIDSYIDYFTKDTVSFFDYFKGEDSIIFIDEPARVLESAQAVSIEFSHSMAGRLEMGYILPGQADAVFEYKPLLAKLSQYQTVLVSTLEYRFAEIPVRANLALQVRSIGSYNSNFELLIKDLASWKKQGYRVVLLTGSRSRAERLAQDLRDEELNAITTEDDERVLQPGEILVASGSLARGFEYPLIKFAVVSDSDIFGSRKSAKPRKKAVSGDRLSDYSQLSNGDYVVHENYGVGIYRGIEKIEVDHVIKDYIKVEYAGGGTLFVLATSMGLLQKYSGPEGKAPKINKLDSAEWKNTKTKVRTAVKEIAGELVQLYALRQAKKGFACSPDTTWQKEFEEQFPYRETDDQLKAIEDTKRDMESTKIMDRLICGDVGYGKTEIAIRAAFKAAESGKQVAFLVPTTILAQQHYSTFVQRMADYPVSVDVMSRFKTPAEQKKTLERLRSGLLDVVIGTHRLLSKDVQFKNLGLLIIDEEQRFGVSHKEKIKQMKGDVDVLTLTATPIPRTLHMSLIGIRDMSILDEPPVDRLPIQTFVMEHSDEIIREAINREIGRGGQVYYVYNRVQGIAEMAAAIRKLVPEANVVYAHGQMNEHELERVMFAFVNGEIDVLVSTTIIETGLDISNVNTIIIDDADRFGLSQLYQLRGRVGRSSRTAYAFLMYKRDKILREDAEKRLAAIREFTELGSGFKIAMRDLEIRGAGNLLGAEQSGHMAAVGYDLYCKLLNEAVSALKLGDEEIDIYETSIDLDMDAYIPATYIRNEIQKLDMYKRIANIATGDDLMDMQEELVDRYGDYPKAVDNLLKIAYLKSRAHAVYVTGITQKGLQVRLELYARAKLDVGRFPDLMANLGNRLKLVAGRQPYFLFNLTPPRGSKSMRIGPEEIFAQLEEVFTAMAVILLPQKDKT